MGGILATSFQQSVPLTEAYANATQLPYINLRELSLYNDKSEASRPFKKLRERPGHGEVSNNYYRGQIILYFLNTTKSMYLANKNLRLIPAASGVSKAPIAPRFM